jgi:hypothetical protein
MEVVSASGGVLGPLLAKLTALLADDCARLKGVRPEIRSLSSELACMHAAVQNYTMLQDPDLQEMPWIPLLRELSYDTEHVIDKFIHHLGKGGGHHGGFKEFFRKTARQFKTLGRRREIANQIDDLKARVEKVKELKGSYNLDDIVCGTGTSEHTAVDPRLSAIFTEDENLVGIERPRDDLTNWMMDEDNSSIKHPKILSIVGFGGLGKTTLANEVYRRIKGHFPCHAFVSVSQKPDLKKKIIKDMVSQMTDEKDFKEDIDTWDDKKCITKLREFLQDER